MKRSSDRILTTHVGSLIRPPALRAFLSAKEASEPFDPAAYAKCLKDSVAEVVRKQADIGIDVISDGEFGKAISWAQYALFRLGGFERRRFAGGNPFTRGVDRTRFAEFYAELDSRDKVETVMDSVVVAPITYTGQAELQQDIDNFKAALRGVDVVEAFLPVAAPSSVIPDRKNEYYKRDDDLQRAIADAMHAEYKTIIGAGDDVVAAEEAGEAHDALAHELRMLDDVGGVADDAWDQHLSGLKLRRLPDVPFVGVARIGGLERVMADADLQQ